MLITKTFKNFFWFSSLIFLVLSLLAFAAYILAVRQVNRTYVQQQLTVSGETIKLHIATEISSDIALIRKIAASPIVRNYFINPDDPALKALAHAEFNVFKYHIKSEMVFWINDINRVFYSTKHDPFPVDPSDPENYWYNLTLYETTDYNFNINYNEELGLIYLWVNAPVFAEIDGITRATGLVGIGINLSELAQLVESAHRERSRYITAYLFNQFREITSAADFNLIVNKVHLADHLGDPGKEVIRVADSIVDGRGQNFIYGRYMYRVGIVPAIKDWNIVMRYPLPGILALNRPMNTVFFGMLTLILVLFIIVNIFVSHSDRVISEQNKQLVETNKQLETASRAKTAFLATMSHEIRTPMNAILGITQMLFSKRDLPGEYMTALEKIYNSGSNLLGIINDILDMSKIETGKMELTPIEYDVPSLINDAVQLNIVHIGSKEIEFILDINENLPSRMIGDELRIKQILNNLLSNAIKYTEKGSVVLSVDHFEDNEDIILQLIVKDTGQGMKPEYLNDIFSEYKRFNIENNRTTEGTGIGLNITKKLVDLMDGTILVTSEYGKGSEFTVKVKQKAAVCQAIGIETSERLRNFSFTEDKRSCNIQIIFDPMPYGKVLIVDDMETNLYVAKGLMSPYGLNMETTLSGLETIDKIKAGNSYDIIFMDHMMPEMDGIETTQKLRELGYDGVIVALTANALVGNDEMFKQHGFDGFVSKPIDIRQLNAVLNKFVRDKQPAEIIEQAVNHAAQTAAADAELMAVFVRDAKKMLPFLEAALCSIEAAAGQELQLYTTNVHAIKSALANIGETETSALADVLEKASKDGDTGVILAQTPKLIDALTVIIANAEAAASDTNLDADENPDYLCEQLKFIQNACEEYDDMAAKAALESLKKMKWKKETKDVLDKIAEHLLHSNFEKAGSEAASYLRN